MKQERETDKRLISPEKMTDAELQAAAGFFGSYRSCHYGRQVIDMIRSRSRNAGPRCLSKGDVLLGIFPENISKLEYGNLPYTDFIRTKTLCQGGDVCNFKFIRHQTNAGDGWERTKSI